MEKVRKMDKASMTPSILSCITRWRIVSFTGIKNTKNGPGLGEKILSLIFDMVSEMPV